MSEFARISLTDAREDIASASETDRHGFKIRACAPGSVGRAVIEAREIRFKKMNDSQKPLQKKLMVPMPRTSNFVSQPLEIRRMVYGKSEEEKRADDGTSLALPKPIGSWSPKERMKNLGQDRLAFEKSQRLMQPGSSNPLGSTSSSYNLPIRSGLDAFVRRLQRNLLDRCLNLPYFLGRAAETFSSVEHISGMVERSGAHDLIERESNKSSSELDKLFADAFICVARMEMDKERQSTVQARVLGRMSEQDLRIQNRHNLPMTTRPIRADQSHARSDQDDAEACDRILNVASQTVEGLLRKRVLQVGLEDSQLHDLATEQPTGGSFFTKKLRTEEERARRPRVVNRRLREDQDPLSTFDIDPDCLRSPDRPVMMPEPSFDYLLPKRHRDALMHRLYGDSARV